MSIVRILSVKQSAESGQFDVEAQLADGTYVSGTVAASLDPGMLARAAAALPGYRSYPQMTGQVEIPDAEYDVLRDQAASAAAKPSAASKKA